jgi:hypothetical protein
LGKFKIHLIRFFMSRECFVGRNSVWKKNETCSLGGSPKLELKVSKHSLARSLSQEGDTDKMSHVLVIIIKIILGHCEIHESKQVQLHVEGAELQKIGLQHT